MDNALLARAYDRSAAGYDERFRSLQRLKYRAAAALLSPPAAGLALDAGAGTGLFAEWLGDEGEPAPALRADLRALTWVALDLSQGMLQRARPRAVLPVVADLAAPPLADGSCALVVAFTSVLEEKSRGLRALARLLRPSGVLVATFLRDEAPVPAQVGRLAGLQLLHGPLAAGQDVLFLARRPE